MADLDKDIAAAMRLADHEFVGRDATSPSGALNVPNPLGTTPRDKVRPTLKTVPTPEQEDPSRTTKQMLEQFHKIRQGLEEDLDRETLELRRAEDRVDDLNQAIRVMTAAISLLSTDPSR